MRRPASGSPTRFPAGSRAPSKRSCAVTDDRMPILCSGGPALTPGAGAGTWKQLIPRDRPGPSGSPEVRANSA